uniref:Uncharacterized protein n=1 Tax=Cacopsylla melanoneura TaxID=428564 RepID=A0A8D8R3Q2_9HEMI
MENIKIKKDPSSIIPPLLRSIRLSQNSHGLNFWLVLNFRKNFLSKISTRKFDFLSYESYKISRIVSQFVYRYLFIKFLQVFSSRIQKLLRHHSSTIISYPVLTFPFHQISKTLVLLFTSFRLNIPREQIQMD